MDGIDGLAAGEAVVAGAGATMLLHAGGYSGLAWTTAVVSGASGGFLVWNWPPAKIFMGDVGSGLLGFLFATSAVASENAGGPPLLAWLLLLGVFVFDATVTLFRRLARGERVYEAHRSHAYQRAVQAGWSHRFVTGVALALTAVLSLFALAAVHAPERLVPAAGLGLVLLGLAYVLLERRTRS
jgi:Fuc2NAc and GlcNAc transferase